MNLRSRHTNTTLVCNNIDGASALQRGNMSERDTYDEMFDNMRAEGVRLRVQMWLQVRMSPSQRGWTIKDIAHGAFSLSYMDKKRISRVAVAVKFLAENLPTVEWAGAGRKGAGLYKCLSPEEVKANEDHRTERRRKEQVVERIMAFLIDNGINDVRCPAGDWARLSIDADEMLRLLGKAVSQEEIAALREGGAK